MAISAGPRVQASAELKVRPLTDIEGLGGFGKPKSMGSPLFKRGDAEGRGVLFESVS